MDILSFRQQHLDSIVKIEEDSFDDGWSARMFLSSMADKTIIFNILALDDGGVAGYCLYRVIDDEAEILKIAVDKDRRRLGYGAKMLDDIISFCLKAGVKKIFLEAGINNTSALNLYKSFGFKKISIRKNYYRGQDAIVLEKTLK
ncbi:MAG: ribosomal protein S18-alanine N-acetyltransferase [Elusimicrobiota bacterium]|jgi:ribosomal-protein-alanine N-acetyltransferase|nr:ribosomal protein S18-alanine N-acetyltransferase [Elusimicrobiota bacterium]